MNCAQECGQLGIAGRDVRQELVVLTQQLPRLLESAVEHLRSPALGDAFAHYAAFTQHAHPQALGGDGVSAAPGLLQTLVDARAGQGPAAACISAGVCAAGEGPGNFTDGLSNRLHGDYNFCDPIAAAMGYNTIASTI